MSTEYNASAPGETEMDRIERDTEAIERDEARLARDVERLEHDLGEDHRQIDVVVNNKPVRLPSRRVTGLQIKEAAIKQGVKIDVGFQLWEELPGGRERQIGDSDEITVREGSRFTAIAPDDNS
jgi:hypothetical protein